MLNGCEQCTLTDAMRRPQTGRNVSKGKAVNTNEGGPNARARQCSKTARWPTAVSDQRQEGNVANDGVETIEWPKAMNDNG